MDNKLLNELKGIETAISTDWEQYSSEILELFVFLIYLRLIPFLSPNNEKEILQHINNDEISKIPLNDRDNYLPVNEIWEYIYSINYENFVSNFNVVLDKILSNLAYDYKELLNEPVSPEIPQGEDENNSDYKKKKEEYEKLLKQYEDVKNILVNSLNFLSGIESLYDIEYVNEQFRKYLLDLKERYNRIPFSFIDPKIFNLFNNLSFLHIKSVYVSYPTFNFFSLIEGQTDIRIYFNQISLIGYVLVNIFNLNYNKTYKPNPKNLVIFDFSETEVDLIRVELEKINILDIKHNNGKTYIIFNRKRINYKLVQKFLGSLNAQNVLHTILYAPFEDVIILEVYYPVNNNIIHIYNYDDIISSQSTWKHRKVNVFSDLDVIHSTIIVNSLLYNGISLAPIFESSSIVLKIKEIANIITGNVPLSFKISRRKKEKKLIISDKGKTVILKNDIIESDEDVIKNTKLKRINTATHYTATNKKAIIFTISDSKVYLKKFEPDNIVENLYLPQGIFALELKTEKYELDLIYQYIITNLLRFNEKLFQNNQTLEFIQSLLNEEIVLPQKEEIKKELEKTKIIESEKNILNEFRHNSNGKIIRTIQNLNKFYSFIKDEGLLSTVLYEYAEEEGVPNISEEVGSLVRTTLEEQKYVQKYLSEMKQLFSEIDYEHFTIIDLVYELEEIKSRYLHEDFSFIVDGKKNIYKIFAHKVYFRELIEQLIENAKEHGFTKTINNKEIKFEFGIKEDRIIMTYFNNGKEFKTSKEDYTLLGKTSQKGTNTGYGGAMIEKYVNAFNGYFEIIPCRSMMFKFYFPIKRRI